MAKVKTDFLVIGSGVAGLSYALKVADKGKVLLISKTSLQENSTRYAQGGIAVVTDPADNVEEHIEDTLICGDGLCKREVVEMVVKEAPERIRELINIGVDFDRKKDGSYDLAREGGHSQNRISHYKDITGQHIEDALLKKVLTHPNITTRENAFAIDLITQHHLGELIKRTNKNIKCFGAYVLNLNTKQIDTILAKITVIASGGIGSVYLTSTNPAMATGDGIAMVYRAKGIIENMEFIQFHPTSLYNPGETPSFLITEALRGFGALLKNSKGEIWLDGLTMVPMMNCLLLKLQVAIPNSMS